MSCHNPTTTAVVDPWAGKILVRVGGLSAKKTYRYTRWERDSGDVYRIQMCAGVRVKNKRGIDDGWEGAERGTDTALSRARGMLWVSGRRV